MAELDDPLSCMNDEDGDGYGVVVNEPIVSAVQETVAAAMSAAAAAATGYPRPPGCRKAPNGTYWDGHTEPA